MRSTSTQVFEKEKMAIVVDTETVAFVALVVDDLIGQRQSF
jgi:chemotaxis protein histidine kinase CheA